MKKTYNDRNSKKKKKKKKKKEIGGGGVEGWGQGGGRWAQIDFTWHNPRP